MRTRYRSIPDLYLHNERHLPTKANPLRGGDAKPRGSTRPHARVSRVTEGTFWVGRSERKESVMGYRNG